MHRIYSPSDFGDVLRYHRKKSDLTQVEAAQLSAVSQRLWSECEGGKRDQVGLQTALRMLQTVGADLVAVERGPIAAPGPYAA